MEKNVFLKIAFMLVGMWLLSGNLQAQEHLLTGTVYDGETKEPMPGASVIIKGTATGITTDLDGKFQINVSDGATIVVSFVGFLSEELVMRGQTDVSVNLTPELTELTEIVVIGYGTQKKIDKTGAVSQVKAEEMNGGVLTDPIQAIQGKSSGVLITKKGGDPNSGFSVKIRGSSGFDSNTEPLYVIDGVPGVDPTTIATEDIETFNILKDAASTAIYGSRGSNGVILITTKKGKKGSTKIHVNAKLSIEKVANTVDLLSADELRNFASDNGLNMVDGGSDTDWQDEIFKTGLTQSYNLGFSGGTEKSTYYASLTQSDWEGIMEGTAKQRTIAKINLSHKGINDRVTFTGSISGAFESNDYENYDGYNKDDIIYQALSRNPTDPVFNDDGTYHKTSREFNYENPVATIHEIDNIRDAKRFFGSFKTDVELFEGFTGTLNIGYTRDDHESSYFRPQNLYATADNGWARKRYENTQTKLLEAYATYNKTIASSHNLTATAGYSWQESVFNGFYAEGAGPQSEHIKYNNLSTLVDINRNSINSWKGMWRLIGFFGRVQYNYESKYYVSGSIRRDGSSKFGENNRWGVFPTVSSGWNLDRESFMESISWLDQLKLRATYGLSGNQEIEEYRSQTLFEPIQKITDPETGQPAITFGQNWNENPDLKWEETTEINIGVDFGFLGNRVNGSLELYQKNTNDLLGEYAVEIGGKYSYPKVWANSGKVENKGIELNIQWYAISQTNFKYKTGITFSANNQEMVDLGEFAPEDGVRKEGYLSGRGLIGDQNYITGIILGEEIGAFYLPVYVRLSDDEFGKKVFLYKSKSGGITRELSNAQREVIGSPLPDAEIGWTNNMTFFSNWTLDISFRALIGNDVYNATQMFFDYNGNIPNLNGVPEAIDWYEKGRGGSPAIADIYVEDGSFLRLDYVSLGYSFNTKNIDWLTNLKVFVAGNNIFTITGYKGVDPETTYDGVSFGVDQYNVYPKSRSLSFGINATF